VSEIERLCSTGILHPSPPLPPRDKAFVREILTGCPDSSCNNKEIHSGPSYIVIVIIDKY
jgi:hypothetical protein